MCGQYDVLQDESDISYCGRFGPTGFLETTPGLAQAGPTFDASLASEKYDCYSESFSLVRHFVIMTVRAVVESR